MSRPTDDELKMALAEAARMREQGEDEHHVAKALLSLNYRMHFMEDLLEKVQAFFHSGQAAREHSVLVQAIDKAEEASRMLGEDHQPFS